VFGQYLTMLSENYRIWVRVSSLRI